MLKTTLMPYNFRQHLGVNTHVPSFQTKSAFPLELEMCLAHFLALTIGMTLKHLDLPRPCKAKTCQPASHDLMKWRFPEAGDKSYFKHKKDQPSLLSAQDLHR